MEEKKSLKFCEIMSFEWFDMFETPYQKLEGVFNQISKHLEVG